MASQQNGSIDHMADSKDMGMSLNATPATSIQTYVCDRCEQKVSTISKDEHEDWHFAEDLQAQEQDGPSTSQTPAQASKAPQKLDSTHTGGGDMKDQPPQYAPPSHAPPRNRISNRTTTHRPHTNQVIEAAKIRARDEVCLPSRIFSRHSS